MIFYKIFLVDSEDGFGMKIIYMLVKVWFIFGFKECFVKVFGLEILGVLLFDNLEFIDFYGFFVEFVFE